MSNMPILDGFQSREHIQRERRKAQELRKSQWWRQQLGAGRCHHCGGTFPREALTMDHLIPVSRGGRSTKKNVVVACKACNVEKGCLFPVERAFLEMEAEREAESTDPSAAP